LELLQFASKREQRLPDGRALCHVVKTSAQGEQCIERDQSLSVHDRANSLGYFLVNVLPLGIRRTRPGKQFN
jgi:hypothetical protein